MNYKEKYEEALDNFKKIKAANKDNKKLIDFIEYKYPELKESEDEKIRKNLREFLLDAPSQDIVSHHLDLEETLNWLEKQGEQKEINLVEILKHYPRETELYSPLYGKLWLAEVDEEHEIITCYKHILSEGDVRAILEQEDTVSFYSNGTTGLPDFNISKECMLFLYDINKQGEQKPNFCHHKVDLSDCSEEYRKGYYDGWNNCNQQHSQLKAEQKSNWGEEDEKIVSMLVSRCNGTSYTSDNLIKMKSWLKSLKERMKGE